MKKMRIAITGGIGSGKSIALEIIRQMGYEVFSCDAIYKEIANQKDYVDRLDEEFGKVSMNGRLDRALLAKIVFSDEKKLKRLNEIAHPLVMDALLNKMDVCEGVSFAEIPLLFEGGYEVFFDKIIVIIRDRAERVASVVDRDKIDEISVLTRMEKQFDYDRCLESKKSEKVYVLKNEGDKTVFFAKVKELVKHII